METEPLRGESLVDRAYWEALRRMTGTERSARAVSLYDSIVRMTRHRVARRHPGLTEREVRLRTAAILYQSDPGALELLRREGLP